MKKWLILASMLMILPMITYAIPITVNAVLNETNSGNIGDAQTSGTHPTFNYGISGTMEVFRTNFNVFTLWNLSIIKSGSTILNANLSLYAYHVEETGHYYNAFNTSTYALNDCDLEWEEGTEDGNVNSSCNEMTWDIQPDEDALQDNISTAEASQWVYFNVTNAVMASFNANQNMSIAIIGDAINPPSYLGEIYFHSKENETYRPQLSITYLCYPHITCGSWSSCVNYTQSRNCDNGCFDLTVENNSCYSGNTSFSYCFDNDTLITGNIIIYDGKEYSFAEPKRCGSGCDNITMACSPMQAEQNMINFGIIILIIVGIGLLYKWWRR